jgi:uncharacterized repeat protein (TIGR01451 family)
VSRYPTPIFPPNVALTDLQLDFAVVDGFRAGAPGTYAVTVFNAGTMATNALITLTDTLGDGLVVTSIEAPQWSCRTVTHTVTCTRTAAIAGLDRAEIRINVVLPRSAFPMVSNTVTLAYSGDTLPINNSKQRFTTVRGPHVTGP